MDLAVDTRGLSRDFGSFRAVDGIDLAVPAGSFYGFLGPNGAGKSTTIKCLTGLLRPTAGDEGMYPITSLSRLNLKAKGLKIYEPDVAAFRKHVQEQYLASEQAKAWPAGMVEKINAL